MLAGPWVNNCVGHGNYGHFCRFLFFVDVACAYHLWMISTRAFHSLAFSVDPSTFQIVMLVLNYTACVPVIIAVGVFSLYHLWSVCVNTTTIEGWEKDKVATLRRRGKIREVRPTISRRLSASSPAGLTSLPSPPLSPSLAVPLPLPPRLPRQHPLGPWAQPAPVAVAAASRRRRLVLPGRCRNR